MEVYFVTIFVGFYGKETGIKTRDNSSVYLYI